MSEKQTSKRLDMIEQDSPLIRNQNALKEAFRLADLYADIEPEPYILPLDALAGSVPFPCKIEVK